jgi:hypothetical protein
MNELEMLANKYGTDKGAMIGGMNHMYTDIYEPLMRPIRNDNFHMVEIGIGSGASARMWYDYFPNAMIHVVDISKKAVDSLGDKAGSRLIRHLGDESSSGTWVLIPGNLQFVIDDGSHIPDNQMKMFIENFHKVKPGGFWIIEDLHCNFHPNFNPGPDLFYPWLFGLIRDQQMIPTGGGSGNFYLEREKSESWLNEYSRLIYGIRIYKSMVIFERARD